MVANSLGSHQERDDLDRTKSRDPRDRVPTSMKARPMNPYVLDIALSGLGYVR